MHACVFCLGLFGVRKWSGAGGWIMGLPAQACGASLSHRLYVLVASPHQNSTWWNLCTLNLSDLGLWRLKLA